MERKIQLLDCTLRDGSYIVDSHFGTAAVKGLIKRLGEAGVDIIECGWLKNQSHMEGSTFFHQPSDIKPYIEKKSNQSVYVAMIDWDRYDLETLETYDGSSIDAVRVVFPQNQFRNGIALGHIIQKKGYKVYFQAANTLAYDDDELVELADMANKVHPQCLSVVDTFGAMYDEDLERIVKILDRYLDKDICIGFHSHNNQQLSFALSMHFAHMLNESRRGIVLDASLCGMGRGAGNAATELVVSFLNRKYQGGYDMDIIMDAIDMYMEYFMEHYEWGYSVPYFIAGMYCAHVNNIAYLRDNYRTNAKDMHNIIASLEEADRRKYDYSLLEEKYFEYQDHMVQDEASLERLKRETAGRQILLLIPGKSLVIQKDKIQDHIKKQQPVVVGVNAVLREYTYDYLFFSSSVRYEYAKEAYPNLFCRYPKIVSSNVRTDAGEDEMIINYHKIIKRGWEHFDNAGIMCLRLLNRIKAEDVILAGFDGFEHEYAESYADISLPKIEPGKKWDALNDEIRDIFMDFKKATEGEMNIQFLTKSKYME